MEEITLQLEPRTVTGKAVRQLRKTDMVPAVIHDHGKESVVVMGAYVPMFKAYQKAGKHHVVQLQAGNQQFTALIKQADFDPQKHKLRHIVFNAVKANETVTAEIPVHVKFDEGNDSTPAERASLVVLHQLEAVEVEALPRDLPDALYFDGEKLVAVGDHVTVGDLLAPAGVTIKTDPTHPLATVFEPSALQAANDDAGGDVDEGATEEATEPSAEGEAKPEDKKDQ